MNRMMAPFRGPHKSVGFAGKVLQSPGVRVLLGSNGLGCLFTARRSTATTGAQPPLPAPAQTQPPATGGP
jgi:hypothetical protein